MVDQRVLMNVQGDTTLVFSDGSLLSVPVGCCVHEGGFGDNVCWFLSACSDDGTKRGMLFGYGLTTCTGYEEAQVNCVRAAVIMLYLSAMRALGIEKGEAWCLLGRTHNGIFNASMVTDDDGRS